MRRLLIAALAIFCASSAHAGGTTGADGTLDVTGTYKAVSACNGDSFIVGRYYPAEVLLTGALCGGGNVTVVGPLGTQSVAASLAVTDASLGLSTVTPCASFTTSGCTAMQLFQLQGQTMAGPIAAGTATIGATLAQPDFTTGVANGAAAGVISTLGPMNGISSAILRLNSLTATGVNVQGSLDGVTYSTLAIANIGQAPSIAPITAVGTYGIPGAASFKYLQVVQVGAGAAQTILSATTGSGTKFVFTPLADGFPVKANCAVTTAVPTYTNATTNPLSCDTAGNLRTIPIPLAVTPAAATATSITAGGTSQIIVTGPVKGCVITNPAAATEALGIDFTGGTASATTASAKTFLLAAGQSANCIPGQTTNVTANATTTAHAFSAIQW